MILTEALTASFLPYLPYLHTPSSSITSSISPLISLSHRRESFDYSFSQSSSKNPSYLDLERRLQDLECFSTLLGLLD